MTTETKLKYRRYLYQDFEAVVGLLSQAGWPTTAMPRRGTLFDLQEYGAAFIATTGGELVGFVRVLSDGECVSYVTELVVAPKWRNQGVARTLLDACAAEFPRARLDVLSSAAATEFYEHVGFTAKPGYRRWPA